MKHNLPGLYVNKLSVFQIKAGDRAFDKNSGKSGTLVIKETAPEWIEAFIKFDGDNNEYAAHRYPLLVLL